VELRNGNRTISYPPGRKEKKKQQPT